MRIDFRDISNVDSFINIPPGRYLCEVSDIKAGEDSDGSPRWVALAIGPFAVFAIWVFPEAKAGEVRKEAAKRRAE